MKSQHGFFGVLLWTHMDTEGDKEGKQKEGGNTCSAVEKTLYQINEQNDQY